MNRHSLQLAPLLAVALVAACDDEPAYPDDCTIDSAFEGPRALTDDSELGFSGAEVLAMLDDRGPATLTWHDGATAALTVEAYGGTIAQVFAPPPHQGYCSPSITVEDVQLRFRTDDGRLDVEVMAWLVGHGHDGVIDFVFPSEARVDLIEPNALQIPESWSSAQRPREEVLFSLHVEGGTDQSPYCRAGEAVSDDPDVTCNRYGGVIGFLATDPDADLESPSPEWSLYRALGWWTWP